MEGEHLTTTQARPSGSMTSLTLPWDASRTTPLGASPDDAERIARDHGVKFVDEDFKILAVDGGLPDGADAAWLIPSTSNHYTAATRFRWEDFIHDEQEVLLIRISRRGLSGHESIVALIGHEMYEVCRLSEYFETNETIQGVKLKGLVDPATANNWHWFAWGYADGLVRGMRGSP